ncbi:MAG: hypothetical protein B5M52_00215 [Helicobacteraceae bacterium 4484_230]|nr:MAG: hypothetical protein B5M52_00215 [Helicobacteraceae bacterium 4484_230]
MLKSDRIVVFFFFAITFFIFYFLNYQQVFSGTYESDTVEHIEILKQYFSGKRYLPHPLWHYCTYYISKVLQISIEMSAIIFSSILMTFWVIIVFYFTKQQLAMVEKIKDFNSMFYVMVTLAILMVGPLVVPGDYIIYLGKGSPNIWHNITIWMVKPFAFLTIVSMLTAIQLNKNRYFLFSYLFGIVSLFAKPSFIIMFLPAVFFVALINRYNTKKFWMFYGAMAATSLVVLLYQFSNTFGESEVVFDFLGVWSRSSSNIVLSIILGLAFPLLFTFLNKEILKEPVFQVVWIQVLVGIALYALMAQSGRQYSHANFSWSYMLAVNLLYLFSIVRFVAIYQGLMVYKRCMLSLLLLIQISIGAYYFIKILQGQHPLYISIFFLR